MALPSDFQFSQSSLQDYVDCPWRFYLRYIRQLAWPAIVAEMTHCDGQFYSLWGILRRVAKGLLWRRRPILSLVTNLSYRSNASLARKGWRRASWPASASPRWRCVGSGAARPGRALEYFPPFTGTALR